MSAKPKMSYDEALHAMQSGVAAEMGLNPEPTSPKSLRVGVNAALSGAAGLGSLLVTKGVITEDELQEATTVAMNCEVQAYEKRLSEKTGSKVTLG